MDGVLTTVQDSILRILKADKYYSRVTLVQEQSGDIRNQVQQAVAKLGICAIVLTPKAVMPYPDAPGPIMDPLDVSIDIIEFVLKNRGDAGSRLPASDVAEHTAWLLHYPNHAHHRNDTYPLTAKTIGVVPDKTFLIYRCEFKTSGKLAGIVTEET